MQEITFCELRRKEVVNLQDGRKLGHIIDIIFEQCSGQVLGIVVPGCRKFFNFKGQTDIFIPYHNICKIGDDVIMVEVCYSNNIDCCGENGAKCQKNK